MHFGVPIDLLVQKLFSISYSDGNAMRRRVAEQKVYSQSS